MEDFHKTIQNNVKDVLETIFGTPILNLKDLYNRIYDLVDELCVSGNTYYKLRIPYKSIKETDLKICIKKAYNKPHIYVKLGTVQVRFRIINNSVCSVNLDKLCTIWENMSGYISFRICGSLEDPNVPKFIMSSVWNSYVLRMQKIAGIIGDTTLIRNLCKICIKRGTEIVSKIFGYYLKDIKINDNLLEWKLEPLSKLDIELYINLAQGETIHNKFTLSKNIFINFISNIVFSMNKQISDIINSEFENNKTINDTINCKSESIEMSNNTGSIENQEIDLKEVISNILYKNVTSVDGVPTFDLNTLRLTCLDIIYTILKYNSKYIFKIAVEDTNIRETVSKNFNLSIFDNYGCVFHNTYPVKLNKQYSGSGSFIIKGDVSTIRLKSEEKTIVGRLKLDTDLLKIIKNSFYYKVKLDNSKVFLYQCIETLQKFDAYKRIISWEFDKYSYYVLSVFIDSPNKLSILVEHYNGRKFINTEIITLS